MKLGDRMRIGIASDHQGYEQKEALKKYLEKDDYTVVDFGPEDESKTDYPKYAFELTEKVVNLELEIGILICGTGIGMSMASNKVKGARCAKVDNIREAVLAKTHNNANVIALSSELGTLKLKKILEMFLAAKYSFEERHNRRLAAIAQYEDEH